MLRRTGVLLSVLGLGAAAVTLVPVAATAAPITPPAVTAGKTYVALGDSYAAGFGIATAPKPAVTPDGKPVVDTYQAYRGCEQTSGNYPHILAAQLGLTLTDVTCQGATTADFTSSQQIGAPLPGPNPPPQLDAVRKVQPDLVTITIGGNDFGFFDIALDCLAGGANGPLLAHPNVNSCKELFASANRDPAAALPTVLAKVTAAIAEVKAAAPRAKIAVIDYPAIAPDATNRPAIGCYTKEAFPAGVKVPLPLPGLNNVAVASAFPFTDADVPYLQQLQQGLNAGIASVATTAGVGYAEIYPSSLSHSACEDETARWVEPVIPDQTTTVSRNFLHPNVAGTTAMAAALAPVVTTLLAPPATTSPAPSTGATTSAPAAAGSTQAAGTAPLANTGPGVPVAWLLGLAGVLLLSGGVALGAARQRGAARH